MPYTNLFDTVSFYNGTHFFKTCYFVKKKVPSDGVYVLTQRFNPFTLNAVIVKLALASAHLLHAFCVQYPSLFCYYSARNSEKNQLHPHEWTHKVLQITYIILTTTFDNGITLLLPILKSRGSYSCSACLFPILVDFIENSHENNNDG